MIINGKRYRVFSQIKMKINLKKNKTYNLVLLEFQTYYTRHTTHIFTLHFKYVVWLDFYDSRLNILIRENSPRHFKALSL